MWVGHVYELSKLYELCEIYELYERYPASACQGKRHSTQSDRLSLQTTLLLVYKGNLSKNHSVGHETAKDSHKPAQGLHS